jgi:cytosine permease
LASPTENFSTSRVPESETVGAVHLAGVIVAMAISLPAFLLGGDIFLGLGFTRGIFAVAIGCAILAVLAMQTMAIGSETRLSTYSIIQSVFGATGGRFITLLLSITVFGWYGITATLFGQICNKALSTTFGIELDESILIVAGSALMILTAIYGFRALDIVSRWTVPLMFLVLATSTYVIVNDVGIDVVMRRAGNAQGQLSGIGAAASIIVGGLMVAVTIAPDIARFARRVSDSRTAALLSYGAGVSVIFLLAGIPALATGSNELIENMTRSGLGAIALLILILATWTTNATNLYSASLGMKQWFVSSKDWVVTLSAGVLGTALALGGILEHFISFLTFLSLASPPVAGIYITHYYVARDDLPIALDTSGSAPRWRPSAFVAWFCGTGFAVTMNYGFHWSVTSVAACDAALMAALTYWLLNRLRVAGALRASHAARKLTQAR